MITIFDPRVLQLPMPFDAKLCNYHLDTDGYHFKIETIAEYLTRVDLYNRSMGVIVAMAIPKEGYSAGSFPIDEIVTFSTHFDNKWYSFIGGINDENFVELVFTGNDVISGPGMDFITNTPVTLGLPSEVNSTTINEVTEHSHTHRLGKIDVNKVTQSITFGSLYNKNVTIDYRKITSSDEWKIFTNNDINEIISIIGNATQAYKLLMHGKMYWNDTNNIGTNELNFSACGSGFRNGTDGTFNRLLETLRLWSIGENSDVYISSNYIDAGDDFQVANGSSLRFIRNCNTEELQLNNGTYTSKYIGNNGLEYKTVKIGTKIWTENINETKFRNGDWISGFDDGFYTPISNEDWVSRGISGESLMCYYADNEANGGGEIPLSDILITEHNKLQKLQGGNAENDEFYHLTQVEKQLIQSFLDLPTYADNTSAIAGGLQAGNLYKTTTGQLMIVY